MNNEVEALSARFGIPGIEFAEGIGGLTKVVARTDAAEAEVYLHGAHVTRFAPRGQRDVLFMSGSSLFRLDKPIRGGVPICFPWFGPKAGDPAAPMHGFARIRRWEVEAVAGRGDAVELTLKLSATVVGAELRHHVTIGPAALAMRLEVSNLTSAPIVFEEALHTYLAVGDARRIAISGLDGAEFIDKADGFARKTQSGPVRIEGETDRIYLSTAPVAVDDPAWGRRLIVEKSGSRATVVWNPHVAKAKAMADFGDDEWPAMVCVETANVGEVAVELPPGGMHAMEARIRVEA